MSIPFMIPSTSQTHMADASLSGVTITSHATTAHTKGSWTELIADSGLEAQQLWVSIHGLATSGTNTACLVDIGFGAASSEVVYIADIIAWGAQISDPPSHRLHCFPIRVPANTRISARSQSAIVADTCVVKVTVGRGPLFIGTSDEIITYGADTATSDGTSVPQANQPSWGAWTAVGSTTTRPHNVFIVLYGALNETTLADKHILIEIGYGPNSSSVTSIGVVNAVEDGSEVLGSCWPHVIGSNGDVAVGEQLFARMKVSGSAENRGIAICAGYINGPS